MNQLQDILEQIREVEKEIEKYNLKMVLAEREAEFFKMRMYSKQGIRNELLGCYARLELEISMDPARTMEDVADAGHRGC